MRRRQAGNFHVAINIPEELLVLLLLHYIYIEHVKARNLHILLFQGILVSLIQCGNLEIFSIIETNCPKGYFKNNSNEIPSCIIMIYMCFPFYYDSKEYYKFYYIGVDDYGCDVLNHEPLFYLLHRRRSTRPIVTTIKNKIDITKGIVARLNFYNSFEVFKYSF